MASKKISILLLIIVGLFVIIIGFLIGPISQPQTYHHFADTRSFLGIPNAWNVLSNLLFALGGIWGLFLLFFKKSYVKFIDPRERLFWTGLSVGLILTAIGSAYYHLSPDNHRLVWDRLPMTIVFMSFVAALIAERISVKFGLWLWPLLLIIGFYSVYTWWLGERQGIGDLRLYLGVLVFTILLTLALAPMPCAYDRTYDRSWDLAIAVILFGLARLCEIYDHQIYEMSEGIISGHALKHFPAALAGIWLLRMIWKRRIIKV